MKFSLDCVTPNSKLGKKQFCLTDCGPSEGCSPDDSCIPDDSCRPDNCKPSK